MSYILDALRRSQAERERGRVPGLDAQLAPSGPAVPGRGGGRPAMWIGGAAAIALAAAFAVLLWRREPPAAASPAAPVAAPARPAPAAQSRPDSPLAAPLPRVVSAPPTPLAAAAAASAVATTPTAAPAAPAATLSSAARSSDALPLAALTAEQRRELPPLAIGGSVWSESAASRFIIVGGQIVHEGEVAAPGVTVERIGPKSAVLRWRELRIELAL